MKSLLCVALGGAAAACAAPLPDAEPIRDVVEVRSAASRRVMAGPAENFTGTVSVSSPFQAVAPGTAGGATVTFSAGARTAWHTHPRGQTLIVVEGLGLVQQQGQPAHVIRSGDIVTIPPHVRHWHGAGPSGPMVHLAIAEKENGTAVTWQDKVTEQDYRAALAAAGLPLLDAKTPSPRSETLTARQRAIVLTGAFMATSDMPRLNAALNQGLGDGLTISEAKEVLVQLYAYAGFPRSLNALGELLKVVDLRKQQGHQDDPGREPSRPVVTSHALVAVGQTNQSEISGGPVQGPVFELAPVINQFLQAHLFGDIFERDNLDWQSRELATVGALAATPGAQAQLRSHMRASLRVGLTAEQLKQLVQALAEHVGPDEAARANEALDQAISAATKG